jgi:hypothetical protein
VARGADYCFVCRLALGPAIASPPRAAARIADAVPSRSTIARPGGCSSPRLVERCTGLWHCSDAVTRGRAIAFTRKLKSRRPSPDECVPRKAIARQTAPGSSCTTTARPGRTSSPPRPARRLLTWHCARPPLFGLATPLSPRRSALCASAEGQRDRRRDTCSAPARAKPRSSASSARSSPAMVPVFCCASDYAGRARVAILFAASDGNWD